jgi:hypothetical protein
MALEFRGKNSRLYYYKKQRVGGRVVSSYCGSGQLARLFYRLDQSEAARLEELKLAGLEELKRISAPLEEFDRALDGSESLLKLLVDANLIAGGYHRHNRQWRKRRGEERIKEKELTTSNDDNNRIK